MFRFRNVVKSIVLAVMMGFFTFLISGNNDLSRLVVFVTAVVSCWLFDDKH